MSSLPEGAPHTWKDGREKENRMLAKSDKLLEPRVRDWDPTMLKLQADSEDSTRVSRWGKTNKESRRT